MREKRLSKYLQEKLRKVKVICVDVDGTLTDKQHRISTHAIEAIRKLEKSGRKVVLVSGNALPIVGTLARYIGTCGYVIGENGCVIGKLFTPLYIVECDFPRELVTKIFLSLGFKESPTNRYRYVDLAFTRTKKTANMSVKEIMEILKKNGIKAEVTDSGFAVHVMPPGINKGFGIKKLAEILGVSLENILAIGDGDNDMEMLRMAGVSACPSNASENLKKIVDIVLSRENGEGFYELVENYIS